VPQRLNATLIGLFAGRALAIATVITIDSHMGIVAAKLKSGGLPGEHKRKYLPICWDIVAPAEVAGGAD
jgi:hypothetical protein